MQLFSANATILVFFKYYFCPHKVEKTILKSCSEKFKSTFFLTALSCPNGQNRRIHVPKCGLQTNCIQNLDFNSSLLNRSKTILHCYTSSSLNLVEIMEVSLSACSLWLMILGLTVTKTGKNSSSFLFSFNVPEKQLFFLHVLFCHVFTLTFDQGIPIFI